MPTARKTPAAEKAKPARKTKSPPKATPSAAAFVLLDRSGSMRGMWAETMGAMDAYAEALGKGAPGTPLTLAVFDGHLGATKVEVVRDALPAEGWTPVRPDEASPRGMTPLYDALVQAVAMAEAAGAARTTLVVVTDGAENASREATREAAKAALDRGRVLGWDVVFLGAAWDAFAQAQSVGTQHHNTVNARADTMSATMSDLGARASSYSVGATPAGEAFTDEQRRRAAGKGKVRAWT